MPVSAIATGKVRSSWVRGSGVVTGRTASTMMRTVRPVTGGNDTGARADRALGSAVRDRGHVDRGARRPVHLEPEASWHRVPPVGDELQVEVVERHRLLQFDLDPLADLIDGRAHRRDPCSRRIVIEGARSRARLRHLAGDPMHETRHPRSSCPAPSRVPHPVRSARRRARPETAKLRSAGTSNRRVSVGSSSCRRRLDGS